MNEKEKEVHEKRNIWKWISLGLIACIIIFGFNMCNPFNKTFEDFKSPGYDGENGYDFQDGKEDIQDKFGQDADLDKKTSNYFIAFPSNKYLVGRHITLQELSNRWHIPINEIRQENPGLPSNPNTPIKPGEVVDVPDRSLEGFEKKVLDLTNEARKQNGLKALSVDKQLSSCALSKSKDMQAKNYFSHTSPTYGSPFDMMKQFGISYRNAGENIAKGQRSPEEVVSAWLNSPGHRANIMGSFTHIGIGHVQNGNYWTQMFISK